MAKTYRSSINYSLSHTQILLLCFFTLIFVSSYFPEDNVSRSKYERSYMKDPPLSHSWRDFWLYFSLHLPLPILYNSGGLEQHCPKRSSEIMECSTSSWSNKIVPQICSYWFFEHLCLVQLRNWIFNLHF